MTLSSFTVFRSPLLFQLLANHLNSLSLQKMNLEVFFFSPLTCFATYPNLSSPFILYYRPLCFPFPFHSVVFTLTFYLFFVSQYSIPLPPILSSHTSISHILWHAISIFSLQGDSSTSLIPFKPSFIWQLPDGYIQARHIHKCPLKPHTLHCVATPSCNISDLSNCKGVSVYFLQPHNGKPYNWEIYTNSIGRKKHISLQSKLADAPFAHDRCKKLPVCN